MRPAALLPLLLVSAWAQLKSPVPYCDLCDGPGPTFSSTTESITIAGKYKSIAAVDFRNLHIGPARYRNGVYRDPDPDSHYSEQVTDVYLLNNSALVLYFWTDGGGSSSQGVHASVFTLSNGALRIIQRISYDTHFDPGGPFDSFSPASGTLTIRSAHYIPGDAHCCVSAMDVVTYRWDGTHFIQTALTTELSAYGRSQGKSLPRRP